MRQRLFRLAGLAALASCATLSAQGWQPARAPLMTRWAKDVTPATAHAEYPRPQLRRPRWQNLNGLWDYAIVAAKAKKPVQWDGRILVPFPVESALSGVMRPLGAGQKLFYRRRFAVPAVWRSGRVLLHFGAVDWQAIVWVDGKRLGEHRGGYDPFSFDISEALEGRGDHEIVVSAEDPTDRSSQPRGKQVSKPHGIWYTPSSGIWQTAWLEPVPRTFIRSLQIVPELQRSRVKVKVSLGGTPRSMARFAIAEDRGKEVAAAKAGPGETLILQIAAPIPWSPGSPHLYELRVRAGSDEVRSYFGLRDIEVAQDSRGIPRLFLNGAPLFQLGPLDQGFWPDGLYTAPTDAARKSDLETIKALGFNMVRKHVKVEPARWYAHCDRIGLLVWQDMPSGGRAAPWNPAGGHDAREIQRAAASAAQYRRELEAIVDALQNHPSIVMWVPFNEGWGQFDTVRIARWLARRDPTRLVDCASGGNDFAVGDVHDIHRYPGPGRPANEPRRAAVLGEFGGLGLPLPGHTWQGKNNWGYRRCADRAALQTAYLELVARLRPLIGEGLAAAVYTQITDVESEVNGLLTYDREILKLDRDRVRAAHELLDW